MTLDINIQALEHCERKTYLVNRTICQPLVQWLNTNTVLHHTGGSPPIPFVHTIWNNGCKMVAPPIIPDFPGG